MHNIEFNKTRTICRYIYVCKYISSNIIVIFTKEKTNTIFFNGSLHTKHKPNFARFCRMIEVRKTMRKRLVIK